MYCIYLMFKQIINQLISQLKNQLNQLISIKKCWCIFAAKNYDGI